MPAPSKMHARGPSKYDHSQDTEGKTYSSRLHILKQSVLGEVEARTPSWKGTETIFRPFPALSRDKPAEEFESYRRDPGGSDNHSDWIIRLHCAWKVGKGSAQTTFIIPTDAGSSPLAILNEEARKLKDSLPPHHRELLEGSLGRGAALTSPGLMYVMQGMLVKYNDKLTFTPGKTWPLGWGQSKTQILAMSGGLGADLIGTLNQVKDGFSGSPDDFENRFEYGDPVHPDHGRWFHFFEKGHDPREKHSASKPIGQDWMNFDPSARNIGGQESGNRNREYGFGHYVSSDAGPWHSISPSMRGDEALNMLRQKWQFWEDILWEPTFEEQAHRLCRCLPLDLCAAVFMKVNRSWIPSDLLETLNNPTTQSVPQNFQGGVPQQQHLSPTGYVTQGMPAHLQDPNQQARPDWMSPGMSPTSLVGGADAGQASGGMLSFDGSGSTPAPVSNQPSGPGTVDGSTPAASASASAPTENLQSQAGFGFEVPGQSAAAQQPQAAVQSAEPQNQQQTLPGTDPVALAKLVQQRNQSK